MISKESWQRLVDLAQSSAAYSGQRRYVIGQRWEQCGAHGWTYHVLTAHEYIKVRTSRGAR
jgi:hypothetical protein